MDGYFLGWFVDRFVLPPSLLKYRTLVSSRVDEHRACRVLELFALFIHRSAGRREAPVGTKKTLVNHDEEDVAVRSRAWGVYELIH